MMIELKDFDKIDMRVGTIIEASINKKARTRTSFWIQYNWKMEK